MANAAVTTTNPSSDQNLAPPTQPARELRPAVDVYENEDQLLMLADMPGASADSVDIRLENSLLTVRARRADDEKLAAVQYHRAFKVPDTIDPDGITAELKQGVLHVQLKKHEKAKPRSIRIRAD